MMKKNYVSKLKGLLVLMAFTATSSAMFAQVATNITIDSGQEYGLNEIGAVLKYTLTPSNADPTTITWSSSDTNVATADTSGKITTQGFGTVDITATLQGGVSVVANIAVVEGKINDYGDGLNIYSLTNSATSQLNNGIRTVTYASGGRRSDLLRGSTYINVDTYPILAIKRNAPTISKLWQNLDTRVDGTAGGLNMVWANVISTNDNAQVYYIDLSAVTYGGVTLQGKGTKEATSFTLKTGTDNTNPPDDHYDIYWIKTFKSMAELNAYIASETLATVSFNTNNKEVKIYPNPSTENVFTINLGSSSYYGKSVNVKIYNVLGALSFNKDFNSNSKTLQVNHNLKPGMYFVQVDNKANTKLVVK